MKICNKRRNIVFDILKKGIKKLPKVSGFLYVSRNFLPPQKCVSTALIIKVFVINDNNNDLCLLPTLHILLDLNINRCFLNLSLHRLSGARTMRQLSGISAISLSVCDTNVLSVLTYEQYHEI